IKTAVSVGDADNDLLMQQVADISFAPSNAMDQVKDIVDFVMEESCCDNVVAAVIEKLKNM
ncbi:MAG: HAD hydrolase family protein, partial [Clostridia bacterium]|nr:HAD hydrolase family protein [Clostridia bacterium]